MGQYTAIWRLQWMTARALKDIASTPHMSADHLTQDLNMAYENGHEDGVQAGRVALRKLADEGKVVGLRPDPNFVPPAGKD